MIHDDGMPNEILFHQLPFSKEWYFTSDMDDGDGLYYSTEELATQEANSYYGRMAEEAFDAHFSNWKNEFISPS